MIFLMRLYPKDSAVSIWEFVKSRMHSRKTQRVEPILVSVQEEAKWVTLYLMSDDVEAIGDFIVNDLGECDDVLYTMTVPLLKMVFLPVSKSLPPETKRYSIMIRCDLQHYYSAFKKVIDLHPKPGVNPTFSAFLLGKYDILLSIVAESREKLDSYVESAIKTIMGVREVEVFPIDKSWIVVGEDDWKRIQRAMLYIPSWMTHFGDDMEFAFYLTEEDISLSGMIK
ncbi:MAG: hypothetical protein GKC03_05755 [Methanomassiliicoccales archaeon]|nr:hypothetical protein [Methanomassiliicoccales archaeon]NYT15563.1 hypothetical protein [Methanomassiliicoccales archaeon]